MKERISIAVVFLVVVVVYFCLVVHGRGQAFTPRRPFVTSLTSTVNTNPAAVLPFGMKFWYHANDLTNSPVAEWVDRISGYYWWQTNSSYRPTWTTNAGVHFDGTQQFLNATNGNIPVEEFSAPFMCVFTFDDTSKDRMVLCDNYGGGAIIVGKGSTIDYLYNPSVGNAAIGPIGTCQIVLICAPKSYTHYWNTTNGVSAMTDTYPNGYALLKHVGSGNGNGFANVTIKEFIAWTNIDADIGTTNYWSAATVSNVYWYATNQWGVPCPPAPPNPYVNDTNLWFWWVAMDASNNAPVSNLLDRKYSWPLVQTTNETAKPYAVSNYLAFTGTRNTGQWMTTTLPVDFPNDWTMTWIGQHYNYGDGNMSYWTDKIMGYTVNDHPYAEYAYLYNQHVIYYPDITSRIATNDVAFTNGTPIEFSLAVKNVSGSYTLFYTNGVLVTSNNTSGGSFMKTFALGAASITPTFDTYASWYTGRIYEVRIFTNLLSPAQLLNWYTGYTKVTYTNLSWP